MQNKNPFENETKSPCLPGEQNRHNLAWCRGNKSTAFDSHIRTLPLPDLQRQATATSCYSRPVPVTLWLWQLRAPISCPSRQVRVFGYFGVMGQSSWSVVPTALWRYLGSSPHTLLMQCAAILGRWRSAGQLSEWVDGSGLSIILSSSNRKLQQMDIQNDLAWLSSVTGQKRVMDCASTPKGLPKAVNGNVHLGKQNSSRWSKALGFNLLLIRQIHSLVFSIGYV